MGIQIDTYTNLNFYEILRSLLVHLFASSVRGKTCYTPITYVGFYWAVHSDICLEQQSNTWFFYHCFIHTSRYFPSAKLPRKKNIGQERFPISFVNKKVSYSSRTERRWLVRLSQKVATLWLLFLEHVAVTTVVVQFPTSTDSKHCHWRSAKPGERSRGWTRHFILCELGVFCTLWDRKLIGLCCTQVGIVFQYFCIGFLWQWKKWLP